MICNLQVSLGIYILEKLEEMVQVMDHLDQYVPCKSTYDTVTVSGESVKVTKDKFHPIALGSCY